MNILKLVLVLAIVGIQSHCSQEFTFQRFAVMAPQKLGKVSLSVNAGEYSVLQAGKTHKIESYDVDPVLRKMDTKQLAKFQQNNSVAIGQLSDGSFKVDAKLGLKGGGVFGAWLGSTLGYGLVTLTGHGLIQIVSLCTGPLFYAPVSATLTKMFAIPIHAAASAAGIACGVSGAVVTGPV